MMSLYGANDSKAKKAETTQQKPAVSESTETASTAAPKTSSKNYYNPNAGSSSGSSGGSVSVRYGGSGSYSPTVTAQAQTAQPAADADAKTTLEDLKSRYNDVLRRNYDYSSGKLKGETDDALRESYIRMRQERAQLPEQLARQGTTGGGSETTLANLIANYEGQRNNIRENQQNNLADLGMNYMNSIAQNEQSYGQQWLSHLLNLAEDEENFKRQVLLKQMGD